MSEFYTEYKYRQGTSGWFYERSKLKLTGSDAGVVSGHSKYKSPEELLNEKINGYKTPLNKFMEHGMKMEPVAREWYSRKHNIEIEETGLLVPHFNNKIGGSTDGLVKTKYCKGCDPMSLDFCDIRTCQKCSGKGMIEIKCPNRMYNLEPSPENPAGMPWYHYDQIQFYLAITKRDWCDYIVYTVNGVNGVNGANEANGGIKNNGDPSVNSVQSVQSNESVHVIEKRITRNDQYWDLVMYPKILNYISDLERREKIKASKNGSMSKN